jgi:hypothetical protein
LPNQTVPLWTAWFFLRWLAWGPTRPPSEAAPEKRRALPVRARPQLRGVPETGQAPSLRTRWTGRSLVTTRAIFPQAVQRCHFKTDSNRTTTVSWKGCFHPVLKRYNKGVRIRFLIVLLALLATVAVAQDSSDKDSSNKAASDKAADKATSDKSASDKAAARDREAEESSSRATRIDISPPKDDEKNHPASKSAVADLVPDNPGTSGIDSSGIQEFHPWNPFKASKDIDIGNFYFNRKNYRAALDRYKEALYYKDGDAVASFRVAVCEEKLGDKAEARKYFAQYLKILPEGPLAKDARASLERLAK